MVAKTFLFIYNYIFPTLGFPWVCWLWYRAGGAPLAIFIMGLPLIYGYIIPGIGTNLMKKWRFNGPMLIGGYYWHHGFIYSSTMGMALFIAAFPVGEGLLAILLIALRTAAIVGFVAWWHDILAVRNGMVEIYNGPCKRGEPPEVIVTSYAPVCFSLLGLTYGAVGGLAYQMVLKGESSMVWLWPVGLIAMTVATCVPYLVLEKS